MHKQRLFIAIAAAIGIISTFLPWAEITIFGFSASATGLKAGGWISLAMFAGAIGIVVAQGDRNSELEANMKKAVAGLGGGALAWMLFKILVSFEITYAAYGAWLSLIAAIAVLALPFAVKGDGSFEMPNKDSIQADLNEGGSEAEASKTDASSEE